MPEGTERTSTYGSHGPTTKFTILGKTNQVLDTVTRQTRRTAVRFCRVQWSNHTKAEATWEREDDLKKEFPYLFEDQLKSRGRDSF